MESFFRFRGSTARGRAFGHPEAAVLRGSGREHLGPGIFSGRRGGRNSDAAFIFKNHATCRRVLSFFWVLLLRCFFPGRPL